MIDEEIIEAPESTAITLEAEETDEQPTKSLPVNVRYEGRWNHKTNRAEWLRIEEPIEVKPKLKETPKPGRAGRRKLRAAIRRMIHKATLQRAKARPSMCPECGAPFSAIHIPIYETDAEGNATKKVQRHVLWKCQCKVRCKAKVYTEVDTEGEEQTEEER